MIKGVHRQIIEVTHTGSPYFERAFLVVRGGDFPSEEKLQRQAEKVVEQAATYGGVKRQRRRMWWRQMLFGLCSAIGGAAMLWLCQWLLG